MTSTLKVDNLNGATGSTVTIPSGQTVNFATGSTLSGNVYSGLLGVQYYTGNSTWTKSTRETAVGGTILYVDVQVLGGGGSGNEITTATSKGGGGAGGYVRKFIDVSGITSSTVTVGGGGAGTGTATGNAGTSSIWSDGTNTLTGGGGGGGTSGTGGTGGTATGGDINWTGRPGTDDQNGDGGKGADAWAGLGLGAGNRNATGVDSPAYGYGAGSGAVEDSNSTAGMPGIVIVHEYGYKT